MRKKIGIAIRCGKGKEFSKTCKKKWSLNGLNLTAEPYCDICKDGEFYDVFDDEFK